MSQTNYGNYIFSFFYTLQIWQAFWHFTIVEKVKGCFFILSVTELINVSVFPPLNRLNNRLNKEKVDVLSQHNLYQFVSCVRERK